MEEPRNIYRARLDFLYQSIAMYAATIVIYLFAREFFASKAFPSVWSDPLLLLLSAITIISVIALLYNLFMQRQLEVTERSIIFHSRARHREIPRDEILSMQFGREKIGAERGVRVVKLQLASRRRPVRIRLANFEHSKALLHRLQEWAGPLHTTRRSRRSSDTTAGRVRRSRRGRAD